MIRSAREPENGLTLIEMLVVIALIAIVASISMPILVNTVEKSQTKADAITSEAVSSFIEDWQIAGFTVAQGVVGGPNEGYITATAVNSDGSPGAQASRIKGTLAP